MAVSIPRQCGHTIARLNAQTIQGMRQLTHTVHSITVTVTVNVPFCADRDDFSIAVDFRRIAQNFDNRQWPMHHLAQHDATSLLLFFPTKRGIVQIGKWTMQKDPKFTRDRIAVLTSTQGPTIPVNHPYSKQPLVWSGGCAPPKSVVPVPVLSPHRQAVSTMAAPPRRGPFVMQHIGQVQKPEQYPIGIPALCELSLLRHAKMWPPCVLQRG